MKAQLGAERKTIPPEGFQGVGRSNAASDVFTSVSVLT